MIKQYVFALAVLFVVMSGSYAFTLSTENITDQIQVGSQASYTIDIFNHNESSSFFFSKDGELSSYISFSNSFVTAPPLGNTSFSFTIDIPDSLDEGTYTGTITVHSNSSASKVITLEVDVFKWVFENSYWFSVGDRVTIQPFNFVFDILGVSRDVSTSVGNFSVGDKKLFAYGNIELELLDRYQDQARFTVRSTSFSTDVVVSSAPSTGSEEQQNAESCVMEPLINKYVKSIQQDMVSKIVWTVRNVGTSDIDLKDILALDTIETPGGSKPIDVEGTLGKLPAGQEKSFSITIDSRNLKTGTYTPSILLIGYCDNTRVESTIDFTIKVIQELKPEQELDSVNITVPSQVSVNVPFSISISNVPSDALVASSEPSSVVKTSLSRNGNIVTWSGKATSAGTHSIIFTISKGAQVITKIVQVQAVQTSGFSGNFIIKISPPRPSPNDKVSVSVVDRITSLPVQATVTVEVKDNAGNFIDSFNYEGPFVVEEDKQYCISAQSGGSENRICFTPSMKSLKIVISPSDPVDGDEIEIKAVDSGSGTLVSGASIFVDNSEYNENPLVIPSASQGEYVIMARAEGYSDAQVTLTVGSAPQLLSSPEGYKYGDVVTWSFESPISWSLYRDGVEYKSGRSENITLVLSSEGDYELIAAGETLAKFSVRKGILQGMNIPSWLTSGFIGILIVIVVVKLFRSGGSGRQVEKKRKYAKVSSMRPKPPVSTPVDESEIEAI